MNRDLRFLSDDFKVKSRHWIENYEKAKNLDQTSSEFRILAEVCNNINKQLVKYHSAIYSAILSFNLKPELLSDYTREDILQAQLVQDEVISTLKEYGMNFNFTRDEVFDMNSAHTN